MEKIVTLRASGEEAEWLLMALLGETEPPFLAKTDTHGQVLFAHGDEDGGVSATWEQVRAADHVVCCYPNQVAKTTGAKTLLPWCTGKIEARPMVESVDVLAVYVSPSP